MPGRYNMTIWRGNDYDLALALKTSTDDAFDLTGAEVVFRSEWDSGSLRYTSETTGETSYIAIDVAADGIVTLHMEPAMTRRFPAATAIQYEIEVRSSGNETTILYGQISAIGGVNDDA